MLFRSRIWRIVALREPRCVAPPCNSAGITAAEVLRSADPWTSLLLFQHPQSRRRTSSAQPPLCEQLNRLPLASLSISQRSRWIPSSISRSSHSERRPRSLFKPSESRSQRLGAQPLEVIAEQPVRAERTRRADSEESCARRAGVGIVAVRFFPDATTPSNDLRTAVPYPLVPPRNFVKRHWSSNDA